MRILKKILYALIYLGLLTGLVFGFYSVFLVPPASCFDNIQNQDEENIDCGGKVAGCIPCELKTIKVQYTEPKILTLGEATTGFLVIASNSSLNYGLKDFKYSFEVYDRAGRKSRILSGMISLYPSEKKHIVELVDIDRREIGQVDFKIGETNWLLKSSLPERPDIAISGVDISSQNTASVIGGMLENRSPSRFDSIKLVGLGYDSSGNIITASSSTMRDVAPFAKIQFKIFLPLGSYNGAEVYLE